MGPIVPGDQLVVTLGDLLSVAVEEVRYRASP